MKVYGYITKYSFVPVEDQFKNLQEYDCDEYFLEGNVTNISAELTKLLDVLVEGDKVVIHSLEIIWRSRKFMMNLLEVFMEKEISLVSIEEEIDTNKDIFFLDQAYKSYEAEERYVSYISKLRFVQLSKEGSIYGRPKIEREVVDKILFLESQNVPMREIASRCKVSVGTVHKYIKQNGKKLLKL